MKSTLSIGVLAILVFCVTQLFADPIPDRHFAPFQTGWFTSVKTPCYAVCKEQDAVAESMKLSHASTQDIFVCRVFTRTSNEYGSNSSDNCLYYDTASSIPQKAPKFQCLCVKKSLKPISK